MKEPELKKKEPTPRAWTRLNREDTAKLEACKACFREVGVMVDGEAAPFHVDFRKRDKRLTIDQLPDLRDVCLSLQAGARLVVCQIGDFATEAVWLWVAAVLARKPAVLHLHNKVEDRKWDFASDPGAGYEVLRLVLEAANKARTVKARATRAAMGKIHRTPKLRGKKKAEAEAMWGDPLLSAQDVVDASGVSESTLRRLFGGRLEAINKAQTKKRS